MFARLSIALICFGFATVALGGEGVSTKVKGSMIQLDLDQGIVTIQIGPKRNQIKKSYSLSSPKIPVYTPEGKKTNLTSLKPKIDVTLLLNAIDDVEGIVAKAPVERGLLLSVDPEKKTLLLSGGKKGKDQTYQVDEKTEIIVFGHKKSLKELERGMFLTVVLSTDRRLARSIDAEFRKHSKSPRGTIVGVDAENRRLKLLTGRDGKYRFQAFALAPDFDFIFDGQLISKRLEDLRYINDLENLPKGMPIFLRLSEDRKVTAIIASPAEVQATLLSVEPKKRVVDAQLHFCEKGETFTVDADADIRHGQRRVDLEVLKKGMEATLTLGIQPGILIGIRAKKQ